jgi:hypothetical protein
MLFSFGIGSSGEGVPSYTARLPFVMSPGRALNLDAGKQFNLLGHACEITQEYNQYVLTIREFDSTDAAATFLLKVCASLIWFGLKNSVGFRFQPEATPVTLLEQPKTIAENSSLAPITTPKGWREYDGHYYADKTTIRPEHKRLIVFTGGSVSPRIDTPVSVLSKGMLESLTKRCPESVLQSPKLRLACEVYLSSHFESTSAASFLSRITTLEILIADTPASEAIRRMVDQFMNTAITAKKIEADVGIHREYESLVSRLEYLRNRSIKSGIRKLVEKMLRTDTDFPDPAKAARDVSRLYDLRSTLVHKGEADPNAIQAGNNQLNDIVPRILRALFDERSRGD